LDIVCDPVMDVKTRIPLGVVNPADLRIGPSGAVDD
jgi:hypothetical protein